MPSAEQWLSKHLRRKEVVRGEKNSCISVLFFVVISHDIRILGLTGQHGLQLTQDRRF